ncbi:uncharacterized protein LOC127859520 [Dreissena polymorpha]|uniref:uncharacterized protein LOC127859520 n=1 Tax=Dreissena polymorpha TaxID=45954 RepID=UPI002265352E|nr:uncharacterized protein LOC127859520 [Dreissena polymorpha]
MATFSQPTIEKGSDMVLDFLCSTCEEKKLEESADYYCESCVKFFCSKCIDLHSQLFTQHSPHGRGDMKKWPVAKKMEDFLLKCEVHKEENNEMFCEDHSQLCCNKCAFLNHRTCKRVILLSDLVKSTPTDLKQVSVTIQTTLAKLKELQENQEDSIQSLLSSYDEQLHKIQENRKKIIAALNKLEQKTKQELKDTLTKLQAPLERDIDKCSTLQDELKQLGEAIHDIGDKNKQELSLIASIKCKEKIQQFEKYQKENFVEIKSSISFQPNNKIVEYLSKLSGLGMTLTEMQNQDKVIRMDRKSEYDVRTEGELKCYIRDICVLSSGQVLVTDQSTYKVKLLSQTYQVVSHCSVSDELNTEPMGICQITSSEFGIAVSPMGSHGDGFPPSKILFIKVNNSQLVKDRILEFQHYCNSIVYQKGDLFVTSGTALFKYKLSDTCTLVSKLHEDKSDTWTVARCAVSPTGDKLYITCPSQNKLLTLAKDGSILATFMDPALKLLTGLHVTPAGQVLVCGRDSKNIIQVDSKGSKKLATLATPMDGVENPHSVCYNRITDSIIVGQWHHKKILVYKVK